MITVNALSPDTGSYSVFEDGKHRGDITPFFCDGRKYHKASFKGSRRSVEVKTKKEAIALFEPPTGIRLKIKEILEENDFIVDGDVQNICTAAAQLAELYADYVKATEPFASRTIGRIENSAMEIAGIPDQLEAAIENGSKPIPHKKLTTAGECPVCGHAGSDCTGKLKEAK
jgi:hypothetical protein